MTLNRHQLLRFAEYATVSASIAGAIAAVATRQLIYAVVPLSASAALNLASRREWEQHVEQRLSQRMTQVDQQLEAFRQQQHQLEARLDQQIQQQSATDFVGVEDLNALRSELSRLTGDLAGEISGVRQELGAQRTQTIAQVQQQLEGLQQQIQIGRRIDALWQQQSTTDFVSADDLQGLRSEVAQLTDRFSQSVSALQRDLNAQRRQQGQTVAASRLDAIATDLQRVESSLLREAQSFQAGLQNLEARRTTGQVSLEEAIGQIRTDFSQLSRELTQLRDEFAVLRLRLQEIPSSPERPISAVIPPSVESRWVPPQLPSTAGFTLEINLGIDFGTGFTKVCFRDLASDRSEIVTFSDASEVELEQALLSTKIAVLEDGTLLTGLTAAEWQPQSHPFRLSLEFIKMRLAHLDLPEESDWRLEQIPELDDPETVEHVCAYYLSRVITRSQEWIQQHRADLFKNQTARWSLNIGVPVEYCDSPALERFKRVLSLAWLLANTPSSREALTIPDLNQLGAYIRQWMQHSLDSDLDCFTTPEISAAVWSFLSSRQAVEKFYTFFDFGDGTLDGTAFRFWRENDGELKVDFYEGLVRPLGVTAFTQQVASELQTSTSSVSQALFEWQSTTNNGIYQKMQASDTRLLVQKLVASVVMDGKEKHQENRGLHAKDELGNHLDVFLGGGGGQNLFFQSAVQATHQDFQQRNAGVPKYRIQQIPTPEDLTMNGLNPREFHRFAVAYGLCIPAWEGPEIRLPSQVEANAASIPRRTQSVPAYEDTKDLM